MPAEPDELKHSETVHSQQNANTGGVRNESTHVRKHSIQYILVLQTDSANKGEVCHCVARIHAHTVQSSLANDSARKQHT